MEKRQIGQKVKSTDKEHSYYFQLKFFIFSFVHRSIMNKRFSFIG